MSSDLTFLDALYPGTPDQLLANVKAANADGAIGYIWHGSATSHDTGGWTKAHFDLLKANGKKAVPVASCTGSPGGWPTPDQIVAAAHAWDLLSGPLFSDMESPANLPPQSWWNNAIVVYRQDGYEADKYGNAGDVQSYAVGDGWWLARYLNQGEYPQPSAPPPGTVGWQYSDQVVLGGITYDVSIFDPSVFTPPTNPEEIDDMLASDLYNSLTFVDPGYHHGPTPGEAGAPGAGRANSWVWRWCRWFLAEHPDQGLTDGDQHGAMGVEGPYGPNAGQQLAPAYSTEWRYVTEWTPLSNALLPDGSRTGSASAGLTPAQDATLTDTHVKVAAIEAALDKA